MPALVTADRPFRPAFSRCCHVARGVILCGTLLSASACNPDKAEAHRAASSAEAEQPAPGSSSGSSDAPRTVKFQGGKARIEFDRGADHVVVTKTDGGLIADSWCARPMTSYETVVDFFSRFQSAIITGDRDTVADMVRFPLKVHGDLGKAIDDREEFFAKFDRIFTGAVVDKIARAHPESVYCRGGMSAMLGQGVVWAVGGNTGLLVEVVNH